MLRLAYDNSLSPDAHKSYLCLTELDPWTPSRAWVIVTISA